MKYEQIKDESQEGFRRLTAIKRTTFYVMINILSEVDTLLKSKGGKPNKLAIEDRLLMALEYLREYRTYFHLSRSYGISESGCYRNIRWVEDTLIKDGKFSLPGRKALLKSDMEYKLYSLMQLKPQLSDLKKTKIFLFRQKEKTYFKDTNYRG